MVKTRRNGFLSPSTEAWKDEVPLFGIWKQPMMSNLYRSSYILNVGRLKNEAYFSLLESPCSFCQEGLPSLRQNQSEIDLALWDIDESRGWPLFVLSALLQGHYVTLQLSSRFKPFYASFENYSLFCTSSYGAVLWTNTKMTAIQNGIKKRLTD